MPNANLQRGVHVVVGCHVCEKLVAVAFLRIVEVTGLPLLILFSRKRTATIFVKTYWGEEGRWE